MPRLWTPRAGPASRTRCIFCTGRNLWRTRRTGPRRRSGSASTRRFPRSSPSRWCGAATGTSRAARWWVTGPCAENAGNAALSAHPLAGAGAGRDQSGHGCAPAHAPPAPGRCRRGQDRGGGARTWRMPPRPARRRLIMAPTDVLARQHLETLDPAVRGGGPLARLSVRAASKARRARRCWTSWPRAAIQLVAGTHALFQPDVLFHDLGLAIVDEQHRFGVAPAAPPCRKKRVMATPTFWS